MSDSGGKLNLTAQQFNSLKGAIRDLSDEAKAAKSAIEEIFKGDHFDGSGFFTGEDDRFIASIAKSFEALGGLVDRLNAKLAITNVRLASIFSTSAKAWEKAAKQIERVSKAASKGPGGGSKGGGPNGGMESGWWDNEGFDPFSQPPAQEPGPWKANWVSSLDAVISADKLLKKTEKDRAKEAEFTAKQRAKSADDTYKRLVQQTKLEEKLRKEEEKRKKVVENNAFVSELTFLKSTEQFQKKVAKANRAAEKSNFIPQMAVVQKASKFAKEMEDSYKAVAARSKVTRNQEFQMEQDRKAKAKEDRQKRNQSSTWNSRISGLFDKTFGRVVEAQWMRFKVGMAFRSLANGSLNTLSQAGTGSPIGRFSRFFGGAGAIGTGLVGKFRMFQKPFPGSERNIFALGDLAAGFNNVVYGLGGSLEHTFTGLTQSAIGVNRAFSGVVTGITSVFSPTLGALLGSVSDLFTGILEKLSSVVASVIGGLTRLATSLTGFATRAVEAAANFTEAVNAARVVSGPGAAGAMMRESMRLQREYGLSATDTMRGMGRIAGMLVQQGGYSQQEAGMQAEIIARSLADVASVNNRNIEDLMRDFMSAVAGRFTPMRKNMMSFQAPVLDAYAKSAGIKNPQLRTDLTARTKMFVQDYARQQELFVGDLERTRYEFANQRRKFLGGFEALFLSVGKLLEPFGKTLLITANDLMDRVVKIFGDMSDNPYETFKKQIASFAWYVVYAKNVIVELAQEVWKSRDVIGDWAVYLGKAFATLALALSKYSIGTLNFFAGLVEKLGGVLPIIEFFGGKLLWLSEWIDALFNKNTAVGKTNEAADAAVRKVASIRGRIAELYNAKASKNDPEVVRLRKAEQDSLRDANLLNEYVRRANPAPADLVYKYIDKPSALSDPFVSAANQMRSGSVVLEKAFGDFQTFLSSLNIDQAAVNRELGVLLGRIQPVESMPGKVAPPPPMAMAGRLVEYMDPARFRDTVQEREIGNAQLRTADATEGILAILTQGGSTTAPTTLPRPSQFNTFPMGIVTRP